ncbi:Ferredoxin--NAD(+) reductase [Burkholderia sp. lig30]|jgi:ferredoxin-NAD(P)+ reductase (naphthalene dioxygenase ferredoxin-specific)|uniref:2Fe-2S iron-sulfur cluster-binding protein n=1 Tax=Burkholderia sp. lig30 TaxID=1192124 RepID=UPI000461A5EE|nr:2Fe-2S iron-sulfur cluster-binding protein [Burkholderia sp. lig30]KDB08167.1 Ferredoxin--NAD(+) reductase [Burkholderia sp. lig30]
MEVAILPLQRTLQVQAGTNLLDTLRANDIPISYSCMAGRCGTCRCKLVAGKVIENGPEQSVSPMSAGQSVLACQTTIVENCSIEIPEPDEVVVHPARAIKATVTGLEDLTHDIKRLRLTLAKPLEFSPGQYATLQFTPQHIRPYSMACTHDTNELEFHVRLVPDGRVTSYIATELKLGDQVRVSGPLGTAYLRRKHEGPVICIAGGTGLAPVLSVLRGAIDAGMRNPTHVYFGVRSSNDVYGIEWLRELQEKHPDLHVHVVIATESTSSQWRCGVVTQAVEEDWGTLEGWRAYLAGSPLMVDAATMLLTRKGIQQGHIYADAFYPSGV